MAAAIVLGTVDYFVRFTDPGLRLMATFALVAGAMWAIYRWWYRPRRNKLVPLSVALQVESHFPHLRDLLSSAVEFLEQSEDDRTAGSAQLRRMVVTEAQSEVESLPLQEVIDRRPLRRAARWLAVPVVVLGVFLVWDAATVCTAMMRLVAPLGSAEWPRQHHLAFRNVPTRMAVGETFEVELVDTTGPLPDDVRIEYRFAGRGHREASPEPMMRADNVMVARRENVRHSFAFRAVGGDDHAMRWHAVEVVEPPRLEQFSVVAHPPDYTGLPPYVSEGHLEALAGTGLEVRGAANEPLSAARILMNETASLAATIRAEPVGRDRYTFVLGPDQWTAAESGQYKLELVDAEGVSGVVGTWNLRVQPDPPPSVSWQQPGEDLYVTPTAIVPIGVFVKDNLAIERVELLYERSPDKDATGSEHTSGDAAESRIEIYRAPGSHGRNGSNSAVADGEARTVEYGWSLSPLRLSLGTQLICHASAADFRPGIGRTAAPRRITIISSDELTDRLADRQNQIVRQLERALAAQRGTREETRRLEIQHLGAQAVTQDDRVALQSAELSQRQIGQMLVDPSAGVPHLINSLMGEIEINQVFVPDLRSSMARLLEGLVQMSAGTLNTAERELVAARKGADGLVRAETVRDRETPAAIIAGELQRLPGSLARAGAAQDEVIARLEQLISELSGSADIHQLAQQLAQLLREQIGHEQMVRDEIGLETLPLQLSELSRSQRTKLEKAAAGQSAIAARFQHIVQSIDRVARDSSADAAAAESAAHAADLARQLAIDTSMQETERDLSENRVGQALEREAQIAADLRQVLDALRNTGARQPDQLADRLRAAEQRLASLREQVAALREQIARSEQQNAATTRREQAGQLASTQQTLQRDAERLADQLERMQADEASQSTRNAANRLQPPSSGEATEKSIAPRPSPSSEVQQAEQDLAQAAQQLAAQRQQAENDIALEFVRRFQAELGVMVERQKNVIRETNQVAAARELSKPRDEAVVRRVANLAREEHELATLAGEHAEALSGLGAVRLGLDEANRRLAAAAAILDDDDTGPVAQQAEQRALARLEGMLQAFVQTAAEASQNAPSGNSGGDQAGQTPQRRPTFELLEVKMLRMLQVDLNERTREFEERLAGSSQLNNGDQAGLAGEAQVLQAEQRRLAELVQEMLTRDNGDDEE
jgi:hypothetical protein